jgi:hypothetical protein
MTRFRRFAGSTVWAVVLAAFVVVGASVAWAQQVTGSISGTVMDPTGASVAGAVVTLTNTDRGQDCADAHDGS